MPRVKLFSNRNNKLVFLGEFFSLCGTESTSILLQLVQSLVSNINQKATGVYNNKIKRGMYVYNRF